MKLARQRKTNIQITCPKVTPPVEKQCRGLHHHHHPSTSKWGLGREAWAALLRVRTRLECPERNVR